MDTRKPRILVFLGFFVSISVHWNARMTEDLRSKFEADMRSQITVVSANYSCFAVILVSGIETAQICARKYRDIAKQIRGRHAFADNFHA